MLTTLALIGALMTAQAQPVCPLTSVSGISQAAQSDGTYNVTVYVKNPTKVDYVVDEVLIDIVGSAGPLEIPAPADSHFVAAHLAVTPLEIDGAPVELEVTGSASFKCHPDNT